MGSFITQATGTIRRAEDGAPVVTVFTLRECAYCLWPIATEQRWVREKIYEPFSGNLPRYHHYHADLYGDEALSCWERHQMNVTRTARTVSPIG
jgi:hypothetical protein